jgi:hypothetical protein
MGGMNEKELLWQDKYAETEAGIWEWWEGIGEVTLTDIEGAVDKALGRLRRQLVEALAEKVERKVEGKREYLCPVCQKPMQGNGQKKRRLRTKDDQVIELNREQRRCPACGLTLFPPG